jgi:predicted phosphodiesterase
VRLGLIADIHGNLPALEAVIDELQGEELDEILCLGDVAVGPQPAETLELLQQLGCPVVMGNWDSYFVSGFPEQKSEFSRKLLDMGEWWAGQLSPAHREYIQGFVNSLERPLGEGKRLLAFHGSPRSFDDFIYATTPDEELEQMLDGKRAPLMIGGHTHFAMVRRHQGALLVNPGSVGLPFVGPAPVMRINPWAEYGILEVEDGRMSVDLRRTGFDVDTLLELISKSGMPHAKWWASLWDRAA